MNKENWEFGQEDKSGSRGTRPSGRYKSCDGFNCLQSKIQSAVRAGLGLARTLAVPGVGEWRRAVAVGYGAGVREGFRAFSKIL